MNKRPMITLSKKELAPMIAAGDPVAIAEGVARNASRERKGKSPIAAYGVATAPAPAPATEPDIAGMIAQAVAAALAAHTGAVAPEPETHTGDVTMWEDCLEACEGGRWAAYDMMEGIIGKRQRKRIAAAAGVQVGAVANAISKHRRGITPDLSFLAK